MKNIGLGKIKVVSPEKFTTPNKMKLRKFISPIVRKIILLTAGKKIVIEQFPELDKDEGYIFSSTHYFTEDIQIALGAIDRNSWILLGTTDQIDHNPKIYAAWLNGMIYVNRNDKKSRNDSYEKMKYILNNGGNVLIYPEGGWNNTENLLVQNLFAGPYRLCCDTGKKVVPISIYNQEEEDIAYVRVGNPLDLSVYGKEEGLKVLRDSMGTMMYEMIEEHSTPIVRSELQGDFHMDFLESRKREYLKNPWTQDVWDEELTVYQPKDVTTPQQINEVVDHVNITAENAYIYAPTLVERERDKKYDIKTYMKKNWNK